MVRGVLQCVVGWCVHTERPRSLTGSIGPYMYCPHGHAHARDTSHMTTVLYLIELVRPPVPATCMAACRPPCSVNAPLEARRGGGAARECRRRARPKTGATTPADGQVTRPSSERAPAHVDSKPQVEWREAAMRSLFRSGAHLRRFLLDDDLRPG